MFYLGVTDDGDIDFDEEEFDSLEIPSELEGWKNNDPPIRNYLKKDLGINSFLKQISNLSQKWLSQI